MLNEGARADPKHAQLMNLLQMAGLGRVGADINLVPTPLLRATHRGGSMLMPMPYTYKAAYEIQKDFFEKSFANANPPGDPDPEFDLQGHESPRWGPHSWRRFGDKVARDSKDIHMVPDDQVDLYAGWDQKEHSLDMQKHYAGQQRGFRVKRCEITRQA